MQDPASKGRSFVQPSWEKVMALRMRKGWTQERLAEKCILSVRTIQNIERGKPTYIGTIMKLAQALGVQAQDCMLASGPLRPFRGVGPWTSVACVEADVPPCPYRGLLAFREEDAELFFGRQNLVELLNETVSHKNITQVSGPSGSGKSSLICAGLIPALKRSKTWQVMYCRPGADPFQSLATLLMPYLEPGLDEISRAAQFPKLTRVLEDGQLGYLVERVLLSGGNKRLLFFIDQFEELYTQCTRDETRQRFLDSLLTLARATRCAGQPAMKLIYAVRADFISRLLSNRDFTDAIQGSDVKIGPMNREELDSVIRNPALHHGVQFENRLAERILNDAGREPGVSDWNGREHSLRLPRLGQHESGLPLSFQ